MLHLQFLATATFHALALIHRPGTLRSYLDLFTGNYVSMYNTLMKLFFIGSSAYIVYLMRVKFRSVHVSSYRLSCVMRHSHSLLYCRPTQDPAIDTLRLEYLMGPCAVLALIFNYKL